MTLLSENTTTALALAGPLSLLCIWALIEAAAIARASSRRREERRRALELYRGREQAAPAPAWDWPPRPTCSCGRDQGPGVFSCPIHGPWERAILAQEAPPLSEELAELDRKIER